ncbi:MAG: class I SAM-dependent methyltransferase [SAR202 cluster bacterium]|nr:class I SAM-dependent methyltransferase [SAR202 cluster bacterium]|tara:strand:+ start:13885 stop:14526 length:642 start_codon:yes stop_codon:yes gene_type:complete
MDKRPTSNPATDNISRWGESLAKYYVDGELDYDKFYNEINYVSPGIHFKSYYGDCLRLVDEGDSWLDAGCGTGSYIRDAITDKGINLFGMDVVDRSVEAAIENGISCIKHSVSDPFPYEDDTFDLVTSTDVLEHLCTHHVHDALSEIYRVIKPSKHAMLAPHTTPDRSGLIHLTVKPVEWWIEQCEKVGFSFIRKCGTGQWFGKGLVLKKEAR